MRNTKSRQLSQYFDTLIDSLIPTKKPLKKSKINFLNGLYFEKILLIYSSQQKRWINILLCFRRRRRNHHRLRESLFRLRNHRRHRRDYYQNFFSHLLVLAQICSLR